MSRRCPRYLAYAALLAAALAMAFFSGSCSGTTTSPSSEGDARADRPAEETAVVVFVIDGDTIRVRLSDGREEKVRLIGIDTPELDQPFGDEARSASQALVGGRVVRLQRDSSERDRYGRLLRYVYADGLFVNAELVREGYARYVTYPPDVAFADYFASLQHEAETAGKGMWATP